MRKSLGQHFLIDPNVGEKIVSRLGLQKADSVMEVGPGRGALTGILLKEDINLAVLEKDEELARSIKYSWPRAIVLVIDALDMAWERWGSLPDLKIIGNLPYNIASALLWKIVSKCPFSKMVFTVQKDVALRIAASPGNRVYGALSAWIQSFAQVKFEFEISPNCFHPKPHVDSATVSFVPSHSGDYPKNPQILSHLLHLCFQKRRKQLQKILRSYWGSELEQKLRELKIAPGVRPEKLAPQEFIEISEVLHKKYQLAKSLGESKQGV